MPEKTQTIKTESRLFPYLLLLTVLFIFIEISFFIQCSEIYLSDFKMVGYKLSIPSKIIPGALLFFFVQLILHFLFTVFVWVIARLSSATLQFSWKNTEKAGYAIWFLCVITLLLANQYFYPNSKFATLVGFVMNEKIGWVFLLFCSFILFSVCLVSVWGLFTLSSRKQKILLSIALLTVIIGGFYTQYKTPPLPIDASTQQKPNIILIGVDSLRPDFLGFFGYEKQTPHMDEFLNQASVFANSLTPLARTFPAWTSILTGQYPKKNGVRTNLENQDHLKLDHTLPALLQKYGYQTIYGTDETRFSNITPHFGFDAVITPPIGFNDFFLGTLNDFPMSNLLVNSSLGKYLFPHSYANRPAFTTYDPNSFLNLLKPTLTDPRHKPLFLAVHFCLPHYPYLWGNDSADLNVVHNYQAAVKRVDQQFYDFLTLLKQNHLLGNSIVVFLSDHGETIELPGDRATASEMFIAGKQNKRGIIPHFYPPSMIKEKVNQSAGHGTDVLGLPQYHTVLAFRMYGAAKNHIAVIPGRVSLMDIKPTLLDLTHHPLLQEDDGRSLKEFIAGNKSVVVANTDFFTESDFSPAAIHTTHPETRKLLFDGIDYFQIDPVTTRLTVRKSMEDMINASKQFAIYRDKWVLAVYPQNKKLMLPVLVNLYTGEWTDDLRTPFAKSSPAAQMLQSLRAFYGKEITKIKNISA
jgi:arylsulfatase A-like enzyme